MSLSVQAGFYKFWLSLYILDFFFLSNSMCGWRVESHYMLLHVLFMRMDGNAQYHEQRWQRVKLLHLNLHALKHGNVHSGKVKTHTYLGHYWPPSNLRAVCSPSSDSPLLSHRVPNESEGIRRFAVSRSVLLFQLQDSTLVIDVFF